ncbi:hypothetical protein EJB05_31260, partial [Eragrostis curvula]
MGTRGGGGGSASRVGDLDVDLRDRWDWGSIPRLLSSVCLFFCSGWVRFHPASPAVKLASGRRRSRAAASEPAAYDVPMVNLIFHYYANCLRVQTLSKQSRGCFGCCDKTVKKLGELSKTLLTHDQLTVGEPFWSTTTIDVSQSDLKGFPPIETARWSFEQHGGGSSYRLPLFESGSSQGLPLLESGNSHTLPLLESGSSHRVPESFNHGRALWEQTREEWTEIRRLRPKVKEVREPVLRPVLLS